MISCSDYDYIEIACAYRYPVRLTLKSGEVIDGSAKDTRLNKVREECLLVEQKAEDLLIVLDNILKMEVKVDNPHFNLVRFNNH